MKIVIIGASGHIGRTAVEALGDRHEIVSAGRHGDEIVDITNPDSIDQLFERVGLVDAVICAAGSVPWAPLEDLVRDDYRSAFDGKVLAQIDLVRSATAHLVDGGSVTLTTGILARTPVRTGAAAAMANGAVEAFVRGAAPEMPRGIRLNAVSSTVLREASGYHATFAGFDPVPGALVGRAFAQSVTGDANGKIYVID